MGRYAMLNANLVALVVIVLIYVFLFLRGKRTGKPIWTEFLVWTGISVAALMMLNVFFSENRDYDRFGNVNYYGEKNLEDGDLEKSGTSGNLIFQDSDGNQYRIREYQAVDVKSQEKRCALQNCYLNHKGILEFDMEGKYTPTYDPDIFINSDGKRVYTLWSCWWTWYGGFNSPEGTGIYVGNCYIQPMHTSDNPGFLEGILLALLSITTVGIPGISIIFLVKRISRDEKETSQSYDKFFLRCFGMLESMLLFNSFSMIGFLILLPVFLVSTYVLMPFLDGAAELERRRKMEKEWEGLSACRVSEMKKYANRSHVNWMRKKCMLTCTLYFLCWLTCTILNSVAVYRYG